MDDQHFRRLAGFIVEGKVIPFLGAGVNTVGRDTDDEFRPGLLLPSGRELAQYLADRTGEDTGAATDLARVSQHLAVMNGSASLYDELRAVFDHDYPPTRLHQFLASLPALLRQGHLPLRHQFIVTTNYDDALERAFDAAGEPYDTVIYIAEGDDRGKFLHRRYDGKEVVIDKPNKYAALSLDERPVIAKIHGAIDRSRPDGDSYVITEDHYIDYLTRTDISNLIPVKLVEKVKRSHFLFLGYSLRDWNLRVILHRIWGSQKLHYKSWAVQFRAEVVEQQSWAMRDVQIIAMPLDEYLDRLQAALHETLTP